MAIIKLGASIVGIRGTIGGMTFSANKSGPYIRPWAMPSNPRTAFQVGQRNIFSEIHNAFYDLSPAQRTDWDDLGLDPPEYDYNSLGQLITLSGAAWFRRINVRRIRAGQTIDLDAPPNTPLDPPQSFSLYVRDFSQSGAGNVVLYTDGDFAADYACLHIALSGSSATSQKTTGYQEIWCGTVEGSSQTNIHDELEAKFGWLSEDQQLFGRLWRQSYDGVRSTPLTTTFVVVS